MCTCWPTIASNGYEQIYVTFSPDTCLPLTLAHGSVDYRAPEESKFYHRWYLVGTVASLSCNSGYYLRGSNSRVCQSSESWTGDTTRREGFYLQFLTTVIILRKKSLLTHYDHWPMVKM